VITSRAYAPGDLRSMLGLISELWPEGRHGIGYAFMAQRLPFDDWEARLWFDGPLFVGWAWSTGWRQPRGLSYELRPGYEWLFRDLLDWSQPRTTTLRNGDEAIEAVLHERGFVHDPDAPWLRWSSRPLDEVERPSIPEGYRLSTMAEHVDFGSRAAAHRSAFTVPGRESRFSDDVYAAVRQETPWRGDLDCVILDPEEQVAAFALVWLDELNRVGELEPVGVRAEHQRHGLGRAVCLHALRQLQEAGAETALVGSRGDDGHPGPRLLYESIGFREAWRMLAFTR